MCKKMDKMLKLFMEEPEREFHVRELAKRLRLSPTTVSKRALGLRAGGLLQARKWSNHLLYKADTFSSSLQRAKQAYNLEKVCRSGVVEHLADALNEPEAIILYGSYAKGEDAPQSDVDIAVISPVKKEVSLERFEKKLGRGIHLFVHSPQDIERMK